MNRDVRMNLKNTEDGLLNSIQHEIKINGVSIGKEYPCYIIAEIGVNHNGQLSSSKKLIDASIESGANAVKFQKRDLESLYRKESLETLRLNTNKFPLLKE